MLLITLMQLKQINFCALSWLMIFLQYQIATRGFLHELSCCTRMLAPPSTPDLISSDISDITPELNPPSSPATANNLHSSFPSLCHRDGVRGGISQSSDISEIAPELN